MNSSFNKMIHFTRLVKIDGRLREFNFKKNNNAGDYVFDVDTADDRGNRLFFKLNRQEGQWSLEHKNTLPAWIMNNHAELARELEEGVAEFS